MVRRCSTRLSWNDFANSRESVSSTWMSISCCTQASHSASAFVFLPRLYAQCAAMPNSAVSCISRVRTWISSGRPSGPITVVCSER